jgi:hypothetical protein
MSSAFDPASPAYAHSDFFSIQPQDSYIYDTYAHDNAIVQVDNLHHTDSRLSFGNLNSLQLSSTYYQPPPYTQHIRSSHHHIVNSSSDERDLSPMQSISPPLTHMSTSDLSGPDSVALPPYHTGTSSPASSHGGRQVIDSSSMTSSPAQQAASTMSSLVHRRPLRGNSGSNNTTAAAAIANSARERRKTARRSNASNTTATSATRDDFDSDDDDDMPASSEVVVSKRREEVRRQRIESEQRRRDELRDGYRRLKDVLPVSNQKSSKVSLLDRATTHIRQLEMTQTHMIMKINELEAETARLRNVNETLMLSAAEQRRSSSGSGGY